MSDTYCNEPYRVVHYDDKGRLGPCCTYRGKRPGFTRVDEYWSSDWLKQFRENMDAGRGDAGCFNCWRQEEAGLVSQRMDKNNKHGRIKTPEIKELFLSFGNVCNKSCGICRPSRSSLVAKEWREVKNPEYNLWIKSKKQTQERMGSTGKAMEKRFSSIYLNSIDDYRSALDTADIVILDGGEAFINKQCDDILDYMIANNMTGKRLSAVTNGSVRQDQLDKVVQFRTPSFHLSIDGIEELYSVVRPPHSWDWWQKQLNLIQKTDIDLTFACVAHAFNIHQLPRILNYFLKQNPEHLYFSSVKGQEHLLPWVVPESVLLTAIDELTSMLDTVPKEKYINTINNLINYLKTGLNHNAFQRRVMDVYVSTFSHKGYRETIPWINQ